MRIGDAEDWVFGGPVLDGDAADPNLPSTAG